MAQTARHVRLVVSNPTRPSRIAKLIADHKAAVAAAKRAGKVLNAFPEEISAFAKVKIGEVRAHEKGEPVTLDLVAYSHQDIDERLANDLAVSQNLGEFFVRQHQAMCARLHDEMEKAIAEEKARKKASGFTKAQRLARRCNKARFEALQALTAAVPGNMTEVAELAAYLRTLAARRTINGYHAWRAFSAMAKAANR
jgi:hypothetical protein